ncbi:hypothetical protein KPL70_016951 [Citrus sinensis]|nr:hypothetical protein KPL70_016951 [Citrus sinensis]
MELGQLDVKTAFLHGRLQKEILMAQPKGFEEPLKKDHVCLLKKSLYGLKQSPRQWYLRFDEFMVTNGFNKCNYDCCVYYNVMKGSAYVYLLIYVDDMLLASKDMEVIDDLKLLLNSEFDMKVLGRAKKILKMEIKKNRKDVECLIYAMVLTRPNIAHVISVVSRYMALPGKEHWMAVKWIMRDLDRIRSLTGYVFMLNGCLINWKVTLHYVVALSTTEAEYTAATEAVKEASWLKGLVSELGKMQSPDMSFGASLSDTCERHVSSFSSRSLFLLSTCQEVVQSGFMILVSDVVIKLSNAATLRR